MSETMSIQQLAAVTGTRRTQIDQWISRGIFRPEGDTPKVGQPRSYTVLDAITLGAIAELARLGISPKTSAGHVRYLYGFDDDDALLVISQVEVRMFANPPIDIRETYYFDPDSPLRQGQVIRLRDLAKIASDPLMRAMAVVNLSTIERRVLSALGR